MKNKYFRNAVFTALVALFVPFFNLNAQIIVQENAPTDLTACLGTRQFSVTIMNNTGASISNVNVDLDLYDHVNYVPGSMSAGATEVNITDLNHPTFLMNGSLPDGQSVILLYQVEVGCDVVPQLADNVPDVIQNRYGFSYNLGQFQGPEAQNSYNIKYADLSVTVGMNPSNPPGFPQVIIGQHFFDGGFTRLITVTNAGNGAIGEVVIRITPENEILYNTFLAGNTHLPLSNIVFNPGEILITISGSELVDCNATTGADPNLFEPGESIKPVTQRNESLNKVTKEIKLYSEQEHIDNALEPIQELYEKFKQAVCNLADDFEIVPLKDYIAFKRPKNIVDVTLKKKILKFWINLKKGELDDPKKIMRDVSNTGHWGNGDYELIIQDDKDLEYIMSLIKQAIK